MRLVAALEQVRLRVQMGIEHAWDAGLIQVRFAGYAVNADVIRLEDSAKTIVLFLRDRIVLVLMTAGAVQRNSEKRLGRVLHSVVEPGVAVEDKPRPDQESGRSQ